MDTETAQFEAEALPIAMEYLKLQRRIEDYLVAGRTVSAQELEDREDYLYTKLVDTLGTVTGVEQFIDRLELR